MDWKEAQHFMMALTMWREAQGEGPTGMKAVGCVIRNRVKAGNLDWMDVMERRWQFSSLTAPGDGELVDWPKRDGSQKTRAFEQAMSLVGPLMDEDPGTDDITKGATFYRNPRTATSKSFQDMIDGGHIVKTVTIGHHDFYREVTSGTLAKAQQSPAG